MTTLLGEPLRPEHIERIRLAYQYDAFAPVQERPDMMDVLCRWPSVAIVQDGYQVIAIGGIVPVDAEMCFLWMAGAVGICPRHFVLVEHYARWLVATAHKRGFPIVEAHINREWIQAVRFIRRLGFSQQPNVVRDFGDAGGAGRFDVYQHRGGAGDGYD